MRRSQQERKEDRDKKHKEAPHKHKKKPNQQERGEANKTKQDRRQRGRAEQGRKGARGGRRQAEASRKGKRGPPGRQQGQEGENRTAKEAGACSVSGVLRGFWITQGRIPQHLSQHPWCLVHPMKDLRMSPAPSGPARLLARGCSWSS